MKVLEEPKSTAYTFRCTRCAALIEAMEHEGHRSMNRDGAVLVFNCPRCNAHNAVKARDQ